MATPYCIVLVTAPPGTKARQISTRLIKSRLAACVSVVPGMVSAYWWKGKIDRSRESLILIKTRRVLVEKIIREVRAIHPYSVPEVIALPIAAGFKPYLTWLGHETKK